MPHACHRCWKCHKTLTFCSLLTRCIIPCACHAKWHLNVKKCSEPVSFLHFWLRHVLRVTRACTFSTSQKWPEHGVLCTFWLGNVLRATTACTFSSLIWPAGSAPAALASLLLDPPEPQIIGKTQCFAIFRPFRAPGSSFFWDFLFWSSFFFSFLLFSDSSNLCFSSVHIVGCLTSKLPSIIFTYNLTIYIYIFICVKEFTFVHICCGNSCTVMFHHYATICFGMRNGFQVASCLQTNSSSGLCHFWSPSLSQQNLKISRWWVAHGNQQVEEFGYQQSHASRTNTDVFLGSQDSTRRIV